MLVNGKRADMFLEGFGLDALISSSRENTSYLTNFLSVDLVQDRMYNGMPGSGENFVQVYGLYSRGKNVLILPSSLYMIMKVDQSVTDQVFVYGKAISLQNEKPRFETRIEREYYEFCNSRDRKYDTAAQALVAAVKEFAAGKVIGVDLSDMHQATRKGLERAGLKIKKSNELFRFVRMVKSEEELSRLKTSAEINERAVQIVIDSAKPGLSERDLARIYALAVASQDAEYKSIMCPIGTKGGTMIYPTDSKLSTGKMFWIDTCCTFRGYFADTGESAVLGRPSKKQVQYYEGLKKVADRAEEILTPGMNCSELNNEVTKLWEKLGLPRSPTGMGHGMGLEVHEYPRISAAKGSALENQEAIKDDLIRTSIDIPFEEGMVLNIEAPYLVSGWGGVHLEKTFIVGKRRCRPLVRQDRNLRILKS